MHILPNLEIKQINWTEFLIEIEKHSKAKNFTITSSIKLDIKSKHKKIEITNCVFEDELTIFELSTIENIFFNDCRFKKKVAIVQCKIEKLYFTNCEFGSIISTKLFQSEIFKIDNCKIDNLKEFNIHEFCTSTFIFTKNKALNDIDIKPTSVNEVVIEGSENHYQITFSLSDKEKLIEKLSLFSYTSYKTDYLIRSICVKQFSLRGQIKDASIMLNHLKIFSGLLDFFSNYGILKIEDINPYNNKSLIVIKNSNLGKAEVSRCNFSHFNRVLILSSTFIDIIPVNNKWCNSLSNQDNSLELLRENYRQLKIVMTKNDDIPSKLYFSKLEMETYLHQLRTEKSNWSDRFILYTNYLSNDFGLSWSKALLWLLSTSVLWYTFIKYSLNQTKFDQTLILDEIGRFLLFINPLHVFDKTFRIEDINKNLNGSILFDALSRIIGAYLIYQFVSAFRKYSKGSN